MRPMLLFMVGLRSTSINHYDPILAFQKPRASGPAK
jgi:hypothetical protein